MSDRKAPTPAQLDAAIWTALEPLGWKRHARDNKHITYRSPGIVSSQYLYLLNGNEIEAGISLTTPSDAIPGLAAVFAAIAGLSDEEAATPVALSDAFPGLGEAVSLLDTLSVFGKKEMGK